MKNILIIFIFCLSAGGCVHKPDQRGLDKLLENSLPGWTNKLTQIVVSDIFTPPVSSRIYAYTSIAAYEALRPAYKSYPSYAGRLNGLTPLATPNDLTKYNFHVASMIAFLTVAQKLVFNGAAIQDMEKDFISQLDSLHIDAALRDSSIAYGLVVAGHILAWSATDGYLQRTSMPAYIVTKEPGRWQPTPPNYADAVETNWKTLRPLVMGSCSQFKPPPPTKYDTSAGSAFYKQAYYVYTAVKNPLPEDSATAWYWDDNPNTSVTDGHITYFQQKNITGWALDAHCLFCVTKRKVRCNQNCFCSCQKRPYPCMMHSFPVGMPNTHTITSGRKPSSIDTSIKTGCH